MGDIQLFLVRVWQERHQFRAAVRGGDAGAPRLFTAPEQVGEFLRDAAVRSGPAGLPAACDDAGILPRTPATAASAKSRRPQ